MLIQSGAMIPDEDMVKGMEKYYSVSVFTGVPTEGGTRETLTPKRCGLRCKGWTRKIGGVLGVTRNWARRLGNQGCVVDTIIGGAIPDQTQRMRIRMKVAIVDVKSGQWDMFSPSPFEDTDASGRYSRVSSDQAQVAILKNKAYNATVDDVIKRFSK